MFRNPSEDKRRLSAIIGRMIPYRVGIEFELFGTLSHLAGVKSAKKTKNKEMMLTKKMRREDAINQAMIKKFNLVDYSEDKYNWKESDELIGSLNEIRVSFKGTHQLNSLWNICKALNENCKIPKERGGIHIHIDITDVVKKYPNAKDYIANYFSRKSNLSRIANIFGGYKGEYNKRGCRISTKGYWVNVSNKDTIEFRIGALNFNYQTIIRWIIELSKMVAEVKTKLYNGESIIQEKGLPWNDDSPFELNDGSIANLRDVTRYYIDTINNVNNSAWVSGDIGTTYW
jgi:hypothetical protein